MGAPLPWDDQCLTHINRQVGRTPSVQFVVCEGPVVSECVSADRVVYFTSHREEKVVVEFHDSRSEKKITVQFLQIHNSRRLRIQALLRFVWT